MNYNDRPGQPSSSNSSFSEPSGAVGQAGNDNTERDINSAAGAAAGYPIDRTHPQYAHSSQQVGGAAHQQLVHAEGGYPFNAAPEGMYEAGGFAALNTPYYQPVQTYTDYNAQYQPPTSFSSGPGYSAPPPPPNQQNQPPWSQNQSYAPQSQPQLPIAAARSVTSPVVPQYGGPNTAGQALQRHASVGNPFPTQPHAPRVHHATAPQPPLSRPIPAASQSNEPTTSRPRQRVRLPQKKFSAHYHITTPNPPVHFTDPTTGTAGIWVKGALDDGTPRVKGHRDVVFAEDLPATITLRIVWPGYDIFSRRIGTKTSGSNPRPLNRGEVANAIYETLKLFYIDKKVAANATPDDRAWRAGRNSGITLSHVMLVNLEQVTQGSWQPELMVMVEREA